LTGADFHWDHIRCNS